MKNKGFTLVEVLIVLAVLGVIAILALPAIISNVQKNQVGPALTKAMATLETAHALMMNEREMDNLSDGCNIGSHGSLFGNMGALNGEERYISNCFEPYIMKMIGASNETSDAIYEKYNKSGTINVNSNSYRKYTTKGGVTYLFPKRTQASGQHAFIILYIDINGINKNPNILGKDLFQVYLEIDELGAVVPYGGKYWSELTWGEYKPNYTWETGCNSTTQMNRITGETCAGSVIDNGGKVIYPWK